MSTIFSACLFATANAALCAEAYSSSDQPFGLNKNALEMVAEIRPIQPIDNATHLPQKSTADHKARRTIQPAPLWVFGAGILSVVFLSVCLRRTTA